MLGQSRAERARLTPLSLKHVKSKNTGNEINKKIAHFRCAVIKPGRGRLGIWPGPVPW